MSIRPFSSCHPTQAMAGSIVSHIRNPYLAFRGGVHNFHGRLYQGLVCPHGDSQILGVWKQNTHQCFGAQGGNVGPSTLDCSITGPPSYDHYRQYQCCSLYQQTGWDPFPRPVAAGTHSHSLLRLVVDLFLWLQTQDTAIRARHIPGCLNVIADRLSQPNQPITTESSLHQEIVKQIFGMWGTPAVDMFATVHNMHLPQFMSPVPELRALAIDALSQDWQGRLMYMFPPFPLISKVIQKLNTTQEGEVILIAPWWPSQPWFPHLLHLCVDHP